MSDIWTIISIVTSAIKIYFKRNVQNCKPTLNLLTCYPYSVQMLFTFRPQHRLLNYSAIILRRYRSTYRFLTHRTNACFSLPDSVVSRKNLTAFPSSEIYRYSQNETNKFSFSFLMPRRWPNVIYLCLIHTADAAATKLFCRVAVGGVNTIRI